MVLCVYSKELRQVKDSVVQRVFWYTYLFLKKKYTWKKKHEIIFFIGTLKLHSKEKRSMRVEIQCVKDIFYFSTKGKLFFISSSLYLLLLSTFTEEFFCVVVSDISCFCMCYCVTCIKCQSVSREKFTSWSWVIRWVFFFLSSKLNSNTEDYEKPIELVNTQFIYCHLMWYELILITQGGA